LYLEATHFLASRENPPGPPRLFSTEIFSKSGIFLMRQNPPSTHHVPPQNHPEKPLFPKTPFKNKAKSTGNHPATTLKKMPAKKPKSQ
jgi:hypothetical protein